MQLVDELSMIYTTCFMCFATLAHNKSRPVAAFIAIGLVALCIFITAYYHYLQDPTFHQTAYALLTAVVLLRAMFLMETRLRPAKMTPEDEVRLPQEARAKRARDSRLVRTMWTMAGSGLTIFLGGFALWNLDNFCCSSLRTWRRRVGLPWGILLEGHGWWHLMTGVGAYTYIVWGIWLRYCLEGRQEEVELHWPTWFSLPEVRKKGKSE